MTATLVFLQSLQWLTRCYYNRICSLLVTVIVIPFGKHLTAAGSWTQGEPVGCSSKCGVAEGESGTPGAVTCTTSKCDPEAKPAPKKCPKTADCVRTSTYTTKIISSTAKTAITTQTTTSPTETITTSTVSLTPVIPKTTTPTAAITSATTTGATPKPNGTISGPRLLLCRDAANYSKTLWKDDVLCPQADKSFRESWEQTKFDADNPDLISFFAKCCARELIFL